jgi:hypothetical protein
VDQGGIKGNHGRNRHKRIVLFGETFIAPIQIEEAKLSHANLPSSEHENLESDLRAGGKSLCFEVPNILAAIKKMGSTRKDWNDARRSRSGV